MKTVLLYTSEELEKLAKQSVVAKCNKDSQFHRWELEISDQDWPKLHIYYYHYSDGQALHMFVEPLKGPKT